MELMGDVKQGKQETNKQTKKTKKAYETKKRFRKEK